MCRRTQREVEGGCCCGGKGARGRTRRSLMPPQTFNWPVRASLGRASACRGARLFCISWASELGVCAIISATASSAPPQGRWQCRCQHFQPFSTRPLPFAIDNVTFFTSIQVGQGGSTGNGKTIRCKELFPGPQPSVYGLRLHNRRGLFREKFPRSTEETEIDRLELPGYNIYTLFEFIHF